MRTAPRFALTVLVAALFLAVSVSLLTRTAGGLLAAGTSASSQAPVELQPFAQRSYVYDRNGDLLAILHAEENRQPIPLSQVPVPVRNAILDVEDASFYAHGPLDVRSLARALFTNVQSGEVRQGGSTITQQLVKNALLTPERDLNRKLREAVLANRLEDAMTKDQILEAYLNTVYFGSGAYGVQAAAETYFGTTAAQLTPGQAAFLAGLIRNPVGYDPVLHPAAAKARRAVALGRMVTRGHLTATEAQWYRNEPIPTERHEEPLTPNDFFVEEVKQQLLADRRLGETPAERYNALFKGGLKIYATLDRRMQVAAEAAVRNGVPRSFAGRFTASLISVEPTTGAVRAMVAGEDFKKEQTNLATGRGGSGRQPGSSFKPFVLATAYENGYGPEDTISGLEPCAVPQPAGQEPYSPGNYEGSKGSVTSLRLATAKSMNCAYIRLGQIVGLDKVIDMAHRLGITAPLQPYSSLPLGSFDVTPLEMASAYATFAADGVHRRPSFVEKVTTNDGKKTVFNGLDLKGEQRISPQVARLVDDTLQTVVQSGTGTRARLPGRWVAGKTGTSNKAENVWFVGFTPQLSTAVWMGSPVGTVSMGRATGGVFAAPIWRAFMQPALDGMPAVPFPGPDWRQVPKRQALPDPLRPAKGTTTTTRYGRRSTSTTARRRTTTPTTIRRSTTTTAGSSPSTTAGGSDPPRSTTEPTSAPDKPKPKSTTTTAPGA